MHADITSCISSVLRQMGAAWEKNDEQKNNNKIVNEKRDDDGITNIKINGD